MSAAERWDDKYRRALAEGTVESDPQPRQAVLDLADLLPTTGTAIDVAGGRGATALWLAERGMHVVLCDVSAVALEQAQAMAAQRRLALAVEQRDVEADGIAGRWDLIVIAYFVNRPLLHRLGHHLNVGGAALFVQPTVTNLERNARPSRRFLLADGEVHDIADEASRVAALDGIELNTLHASEAWRDGTHEARLVVSRQL